VILRTPVEVEGQDMETVATFVNDAGRSIPFVLTYGQSHLGSPAPLDAIAALRETEAFWSAWSSRFIFWRCAVADASSPFPK